MTATDFDTLCYEEKLLLVEPVGQKLTEFLTWYGPQRHITLYAIEKFYAELIFNLNNCKVEAINAFETVDYLDKYRGYIGNLEGQIRGLKNDESPFNNL